MLPHLNQTILQENLHFPFVTCFAKKLSNFVTFQFQIHFYVLIMCNVRAHIKITLRILNVSLLLSSTLYERMWGL